MTEINFDVPERKLNVKWTKEILDFTLKYLNIKDHNVKIKVKNVLKLISAHFDNDEEAFLKSCRDIAKELDDNGEEELSQYILAQTGDVPTFVPM